MEHSPRNIRTRTRAGTFRRSWTTAEVAMLRKLAGIMSAELIAEEINRSTKSIRKMAHRLRLSLRLPGVRTGIVLGQPKGQSWVKVHETAAHVRAMLEIREAVLTKQLDPAALEAQVRRRLLLARGAPLCPSCGRNPQEVERTGLCKDCHMRELARAHRDGEQQQEAQREYDREKQRAHRARKQKIEDNASGTRRETSTPTTKEDSK